MTGRLAAGLLSVLSALCERADRLSTEERRDCGRTARALLTLAWESSENRPLVVGALRCVCQTFESDSAASAALLRRALEPEHLAAHGFEEIPWIAREAKRLIGVAPDFVAELYRSSFGHREESEDQTALSNSRILALLSNRRQDYNLALWQLAETYPIFLERCPLQATEVLISALEIYVAEKHMYSEKANPDATFSFRGMEVSLKPDHSSSWDASSAYQHDEPVRMLSAFHLYVSRLASKRDSDTELDKLLDVVARSNRPAVVWRRLLQLGAQFPETLGIKLRPLLEATSILACADTTTEAGELLKSAFGRFSPPERAAIEQAITSLPKSLPNDRAEWAEYIQGRLITCLDPEFVVTEQVHALLGELQSKGELPANEPLVRWSGLVGGAYGEDEYLVGEGVPIGDEANKRVRDLEKPVKQFAERFRNAVLSAEDIKASLKPLSDLWSALDQPGVHPKQYEYALDVLAEASSCIAGAAEWPDGDRTGELVRQILLKASDHPNPNYDPKLDEQFDKGPSWGSPAPRIHAADGLTRLGRHASSASEKVLNAIRRLSIDSVPAVRFQVVGRVLALYQTAPEVMWEIVERVARQDRSRSILHQLVSGILGPLSGPNLERVVALGQNILDRSEDNPEGKHLRAACMSLFAQLYVWRDDIRSKAIVHSVAEKTGDHADDALTIAGCLRDVLTHGPTEPSDPVQDGVRGRALAVVSKIVTSAAGDISTLVNRNHDVTFENWTALEQEQMRRAGRLLDHIGMEIYFASGAYDGQRRDQDKKVPPEARKRFYYEASTILDQLASAGFPSLVHHLLETLESFVELDPKGVLLRIGTALKAGRAYGYQYEAQAAQLFVRLIERYLAEHREIFQENPECRQILRESLDLFVNWPAARRLVYRLDDIFR